MIRANLRFDVVSVPALWMPEFPGMRLLSLHKATPAPFIRSWGSLVFAIVPLFAGAYTGVCLSGLTPEPFPSPVTPAIIISIFSSNKILNGTTVICNIKVEGDYLIYTAGREKEIIKTYDLAVQPTCLA